MKHVKSDHELEEIKSELNSIHLLYLNKNTCEEQETRLFKLLINFLMKNLKLNTLGRMQEKLNRLDNILEGIDEIEGIHCFGDIDHVKNILFSFYEEKYKQSGQKIMNSQKQDLFIELLAANSVF